MNNKQDIDKQIVNKGSDPLGNNQKSNTNQKRQSYKKNHSQNNIKSEDDFFIVNKLNQQERLSNQNQNHTQSQNVALDNPRKYRPDHNNELYQARQIFNHLILQDEKQMIQGIKCILFTYNVKLVITNYNIIILGNKNELLKINKLEYFMFPVAFLQSTEKFSKNNYDELVLTLKDYRSYTLKFPNLQDFAHFEAACQIIPQYCFFDFQKKLNFFAYIYKPTYPEYKLIYDIEKEFKRQNLSIRPPESDYVLGNSKDNLKYLNNTEQKYCFTYPSLFVIPAKLSQEELQKALKFRSKQRIPALTYAYQGEENHVYIWRCAQCMTGASRQRSTEDEHFFNLLGLKPNETVSKLMVYDARSWVAAKANMLKGKGAENSAYYKNCDIVFLDIENIHKVRDSYKKFKKLCQESEDENWFYNIQQSEWFIHLQSILVGAIKIFKSIVYDEKNVVIHCSDGWDRTSQLCALVQIFLDPYFRTFDGFQVLIQKDFISFGHLFQLRSGHFCNTEESQKSPIFIQFLDCVYQVMQQFPLSFQFLPNYLSFLAFHVYSQRFGTFMQDNDVGFKKYSANKTVSIWSYIDYHKKDFENPYYNAIDKKLICPNSSLKHIQIWKEHFFYFNTDFSDQYEIKDGYAVFTEDHKNQLYNRQKQINEANEQMIEKQNKQLQEKEKKIQELQDQIQNNILEKMFDNIDQQEFEENVQIQKVRNTKTLFDNSLSDN